MHIITSSSTAVEARGLKSLQQMMGMPCQLWRIQIRQNVYPDIIGREKDLKK